MKIWYLNIFYQIQNFNGRFEEFKLAVNKINMISGNKTDYIFLRKQVFKFLHKGNILATTLGSLNILENYGNLRNWKNFRELGKNYFFAEKSGKVK